MKRGSSRWHTGRRESQNSLSLMFLTSTKTKRLKELGKALLLGNTPISGSCVCNCGRQNSKMGSKFPTLVYMPFILPFPWVSMKGYHAHDHDTFNGRNNFTDVIKVPAQLTLKEWKGKLCWVDLTYSGKPFRQRWNTGKRLPCWSQGRSKMPRCARPVSQQGGSESCIQPTNSKAMGISVLQLQGTGFCQQLVRLGENPKPQRIWQQWSTPRFHLVK